MNKIEQLSNIVGAIGDFSSAVDDIDKDKIYSSAAEIIAGAASLASFLEAQSGILGAVGLADGLKSIKDTHQQMTADVENGDVVAFIEDTAAFISAAASVIAIVDKNPIDQTTAMGISIAATGYKIAVQEAAKLGSYIGSIIPIDESPITTSLLQATTAPPTTQLAPDGSPLNVAQTSTVANSQIIKLWTQNAAGQFVESLTTNVTNADGSVLSSQLTQYLYSAQGAPVSGTQYVTNSAGVAVKTIALVPSANGWVESGQTVATSPAYTNTWSNVDGASTASNQTTYNPDGSSSTKTTYASGAYATVMDDGQGNITTDYFTKNGVETRSTWVHSDGTAGTTDVYQDGLTGLDGKVAYVGTGMTPQWVDMPDPYATVIQNPDGSYSTTGLDPSDTATTTQFGADGSQSSVPTSVASVGGGVNDLAVASTGTAYYSLGMETTRQYSSAGNVVGETWDSANPDGTANPTVGVEVAWANNALCISGSETVNASGVIVKNDLALDGSSYRDTIESNGHTVSHYDAQGVLLSDQWSNTDGANTTPSVTGSDSFNSDGSGLGTFTDMRDGTTGTVTLNGQGGITVMNTTGRTVTSEDIWNGDGSYEVEMFNAGDGTQATYDYLANGDVTVTDLASDGSIADQQTVAAGLVIDPDGSNFSKIANVAANGLANYSMSQAPMGGDLSFAPDSGASANYIDSWSGESRLRKFCHRKRRLNAAFFVGSREYDLAIKRITA